MDDIPNALRVRDLVLTVIITGTIVGGALLADPTNRALVTRGIHCEPIDVAVESGYGEPWLRIPVTGLNATAFVEGVPVAASFTVYTRDTGGSWAPYSTHSSDTGKFIFVISPTTETTEAYVAATPFDPRYCQANSATLTAKDSRSPPIEGVPPPPSTHAPVPSGCERIDVVVESGYGEPWLRIPLSGLNASALARGVPVAASFTVFTREGPAEWKPYRTHWSDTGKFIFVVSPTDAETSAFVLAIPFNPHYCTTESEIIWASSPSRAFPAPPSPCPDVLVEVDARGGAPTTHEGTTKVSAALSSVPRNAYDYVFSAHVRDGDGPWEEIARVKSSSGTTEFELDLAPGKEGRIHAYPIGRPDCRVDSTSIFAGPAFGVEPTSSSPP